MLYKEKFVESSGDTLSVAESDERILAKLSVIGYHLEVLQEGKGLHQHAHDSMQRCKRLRMSKEQAVTLFEEQWEGAHRQFRGDLHNTRLALLGYNPARYTLELKYTATRSFLRWFKQVRALYQALRNFPELLALVAQMGLTLELIEQRLQALYALAEQYKQLEQLDEEMVEAKREWNEAFAAHEEWMKSFRAITRAGLAKFPSYIEKLNFLSKTQKPTRKREKPVDKPIEQPAEPASDGRPPINQAPEQTPA